MSFAFFQLVHLATLAGIGRAAVAGLLAEGASVVAFDASADRLETATATWSAGERVRTVGGAFRAEPRLDGGFGVEAVMQG